LERNTDFSGTNVLTDTDISGTNWWKMQTFGGQIGDKYRH